MMFSSSRVPTLVIRRFAKRCEIRQEVSRVGAVRGLFLTSQCVATNRSIAS